MNKLIIIGNLTRDPELRTTQDGTAVCNFTVAVNRKARTDGHPEADYFRVTAWRTLGERCVIGAISARGYTGGDGSTHASLELLADEVEFLTPRSTDPGTGRDAG